MNPLANKYLSKKQLKRSQEQSNSILETAEISNDSNTQISKTSEEVTVNSSIFFIYNPKTIEIESEVLNALELKTSKLTGLQLGVSFLKQQNIDSALDSIAQDEQLDKNSKPYDKRIICFSLESGGLLTDLLNAFSNHSPDIIITVGINNSNLSLIKQQITNTGFVPFHIVGVFDHELEVLKKKWAYVISASQNIDIESNNISRNINQIKRELHRDKSNTSLNSALKAQEEKLIELATLKERLLSTKQEYVTFNPQLGGEYMIKQIRDSFRRWQGETARLISKKDEHGVVDKRLLEQTEREDKVARANAKKIKSEAMEEKILLSQEAAKKEQEAAKQAEIAKRPTLWGIRIY